MPFKKTLGAYIEYEQQSRGKWKNLEKTIRQEWNDKTPAQRTVLAERINDAQNARTAVNVKEPILRATYLQYQAGEPYDDNQTLQCREAAEDAIADLDGLKALQEDEVEAWKALYSEQEAQNAVAKSLTNTLNAQRKASQALLETEQAVSSLKSTMQKPPLPRDGNGKRKMPEKWLSTKTVGEKKWKKEVGRDSKAGRVGLRFEDGGRWFAQKVMSGGQAKVVVWLQVDKNGLIVDRLAKKDQLATKDGFWYDARKWDGDLKNEDTRTPLEIVTHNAVAKVQDLTNVVTLKEDPRRSWVDNQARKYTMYLEWFPHGDLNSLVKSDAAIPEPMIWYTAEALAKAVLAMEKGHVDVNRKGTETGWKSIVHRDLKPQNIFLGAPTSATYPFYPRPAVGDFGFGFKTSPTDTLNPRWWTGAGTKGFRAPETFAWVDRDNHDPIDEEIKILPWTDIYCIGVVLYCMVRCDPKPEQPVWLGDGELDTTLSLSAGDRASYSHHLLELIEVCLSFRAWKRPSASELLDLIYFYTGEDYAQYVPPGEQNPHTKGMKDIMDNATNEEQYANAVYLDADAYRLGMSRNELPNEM